MLTAAAGLAVAVPGAQRDLPGSAKVGGPVAGGRVRGAAEPTPRIPTPAIDPLTR